MTGRVIPAAVNWAQLLKQTAPADKKLMAAFKIKSDIIAGNYAKAANFNRAINWEHYEKNIGNAALVADFKTKFETFEFPVPSDDGLAAKLEARAAEDEIAVEAYVKKVDGQIDNASVTLNNLKALPPFEQMSQQDILFWFPQLCRNQEWVSGGDNCPSNYVNQAKFNEVGWFEHGGVQKAWVHAQAERTVDPEWRLHESQFPDGKYPDFFSSFPSEDFKESFALADPLIQWEQIAHHPHFNAEVNAIQAAEGVEAGFRA